jgi:8-oxo-dGTP pyrophosphatase MutT (NUDIX family)
MEPLLRPTVRVLVRDLSGAVLLLRFVGELDQLPFWVPPGGGIEPGESVIDAAFRELFEETGRSDIGLAGHVWDREHVWSWRGATYRSVETWFLSDPIEQFEPATEHLTPEERVDITGWGWFSVADLVAGRERTVPLDLAVRLPRLLAKGIPSVPERIGP